MPDRPAEPHYTMPDPATATERLRAFGGGGRSTMDALFVDLGQCLRGDTLYAEAVVMAFVIAVGDFTAAHPAPIRATVYAAVPELMRKLIIDDEDFLARTLAEWEDDQERHQHARRDST
ncbi:MAG TPA: hypothetical protein VFG15_03220 [Amycolatopsis sp.]|nr:hypothetical protein [Amycolatopsis sp.]